MNSGQKLWSRAIRVIPGGNGLLSKRPERYAKELWPVYFKRAKGVKIEDLAGNMYVDMAQMGIGAAILGYANDRVDEKVIHGIYNGISTTLNPPEEVYLAEKLLELNPFAGGVKFARTGGEAMAIAVRIARAYSQKDIIAFSGYHGWSDWYIAANLSGTDQLKDHLLPGLNPKGVPKLLRGTSYPFQYNNIEEFREVINKHDIGVIVFEGARYDFPEPEFLAEIQKVAKEKNIVTIIDEITSGWRMTDGGVYKLNGFDPDIVVYGKAMGNGYAISAVVGKRDIMDVAQESFISSTFWTERVGFVAALETLSILTEEQSWNQLIKIGTYIGNKWKEKATKYGLKIKVTEFKPLITLKFDYGETNAVLLNTIFIQEMLKRGYLASTSIYVSTAHTKEIVDEYIEHVDKVFCLIAQAIDENKVEELLEVSLIDQGFKRLN